MEKGFFGQYSGNARHSRTPVTKKNYRASVADDAAHIHYLKMDIDYDAKHGHSDKDMTADEKHISKLAGDMKYDKKHHSPLNTNHPFDPKTGENIYDKDGFLKEEFQSSSPDVVLTPTIQAKRDAGIDQKLPFGTLRGRQYSGEKFIKDLDRAKLGIGNTYQFINPSGDANPFPDNPFIEMQFNKQGEFTGRKPLGSQNAQGTYGLSFTEDELKEMRQRLDNYMAPKTKALEFLKNRS